MNIDWFIINFIASIIDVMIVNLTFSILSKGKKEYIFIAMGSILYVIASVVLGYFSVIPWINMVDNIVYMFILSFVYDMKLWKRCAVSLALTVVSFATEMIMGQVVSLVLNISAEQARGNIFIFIFGILGSKIIIFFLLMVLRKFMNKQSTKLSKGLYLSVLLLPISTCIITLSIGSLTMQINDRPFTIVMMTSVIAVIAANLILLYVIEKHKDEALKQANKDYVNSYLSSQIEQYQEIVDKYKYSNKQMHDISNQLIMLQNMDGNENFNHEVQKVSSAVMNAKSIAFTGSNSINALLNNKISKIERLNIEHECTVSLGNSEINNIMKIGVLIGNILDNAIEECERLQSDKYIKFKLYEVGNMLQIIAINSKRINVDVVKTSKENKQMHGYGSEIIEEISRSLNGTIHREIKEKSYLISVLVQR